MSIAVKFDITVLPERFNEFLAMVKEVAPDTRSYDGCVSFDIWLDTDTTGNVLFYEIWESRAQQEKYLAWRAETGVIDAMGEFLAAPPVISYFDKFDG